MKPVTSTLITARPTPSAPPKALLTKSPLATYSCTLSRIWYSSLSCWTRWLRCSSSIQSGTLAEILATWSLITGTSATKKSASAPSTPRMTVRTAHGRAKPRRSRNTTIGLIPAAMKSETTTWRITLPIVVRRLPAA